ncbi:MAG: tetratricopeptide repeat protein [Caldimicrobium sp.]
MLQAFKWVLIYLVFAILFTNKSPFAQAEEKNKRETLRGLLFNNTSIHYEGENIIKKIKEAHSVKDYDTVVKLHQKLPAYVQLTPEEFLMLAESYFERGYLEKSIELSERAESLRRGTTLSCDATFLKAKALLLLGREKEVNKVLSYLNEEFCQTHLGEKLEALKKFISKKERAEIEDKKYLSFIQEFQRAKIGYLLKKGQLKDAEREIFNYINLTGDYKFGMNYLFQLAEAYLEKGEVLQAKKYYQLIITEWDLSKEAFLSKFRLYQIAYERATIKELLPPKTIEDLLSFITQIKIKYPQEKIAEEASFLEVRIYYERKDWEKARLRAKEFVDNFKESLFLSKAKEIFCKASVSLVPEWFNKGKIAELQKIAEEDRDFFEKVECGDFYYALGTEFLKYNLSSIALYYLLNAYNLKLSPEVKGDYYLSLAYLSLEKNEVDLATSLFNYLKRVGNSNLKTKPEYMYIENYLALRADFNKGLQLLRSVMNSNLPAYFKHKLIYTAYMQALKLKKFTIAYNLLQTPFYEATLEDYLILLTESFERDHKIFEDLLREAKKKFPKSNRLLFLEAYYLEKRGDLKLSQEIWEKLNQEGSREGRIAKEFIKLQKLAEEARRLVY